MQSVSGHIHRVLRWEHAIPLIQNSGQLKSRIHFSFCRHGAPSLMRIEFG